MKLTSIVVTLAIAMTMIQEPALCADATHLSARFLYRDNYPTNSKRLKIILQDVSVHYRADRYWAPGNNPGPQFSQDLTFRLVPKLPTQTVHRVSIPLSTISSIDFQWLPFPRSMVGFKNMLIPLVDGSSHAVEMVVDGHEYRYIRTGKDGTVEQDVKGDLELRSGGTVSAITGGFRSDVPFEWYSFHGKGPEKQSPGNKDNGWYLDKALVDRVEFSQGL